MRDALKDEAWFERWVRYDIERIAQMQDKLRTPAANRAYEPQYAFELATGILESMLRRYSRGDAVAELGALFAPLLDAWETAERLGAGVWTEEQQQRRHAWSLNLDHYVQSFWLVGLALALERPDAEWQRLLRLVGNEGEDVLLDRVIASRQPGRRIGTTLCHPQPYRSLLDAVDAAPAAQPKLLRAFVERWYTGLDRPPKKGLSPQTALYERPYWHRYDSVDGAYFGYWCVEAVAAVKAFGIDDGACLGLPHYPGDLLRAGGASTHPPRAASAPPPGASGGLLGRVRRLLAS